jgi:hypothetical protein
VKYQQPKFTVGMPTKAKDWPFEPKPVRPFCETCQRPEDFCECCTKTEDA